MTPVTGPFPLGHEVVAEVVEVGPAVADVAPGDLVSVAFQISCGSCVRCRRGETGRCQQVTAGSSYGMGQLGGGVRRCARGCPARPVRRRHVPGTASGRRRGGRRGTGGQSERRLADGGAAPEGRLGAAGSGVRTRFDRPLYATATARALGAEVTYVDPNEENCAVAEQLGATVECRTLRARTRSHPIVVNSSGDEAGLRSALRSTQAGGVLTDTGIYFGNDVSLPMLEMYAKGVTLVTGRANVRPDMPAALAEVLAGRLRADLVVTRTADWEQAPELWGTPGGKLVLVRQ
ncbi:zinc-binding dehydrogenase [Fodinicola feengrottensis]|uniref:zinc-binding dehydrogenase n=1 Tax=Fodinicola feengrottensis TaxID=435914 RepID=UPI0036F3AA03